MRQYWHAPNLLCCEHGPRWVGWGALNQPFELGQALSSTTVNFQLQLVGCDLTTISIDEKK